MNSHVVMGIKVPYAPRQSACKIKHFSKLKLEVPLKERGEGGKESQKYPFKMAKFTHEPMNQA